MTMKTLVEKNPDVLHVVWAYAVLLFQHLLNPQTGHNYVKGLVSFLLFFNPIYSEEYNRMSIGIQPSCLNSGYQYSAQQSAAPEPDGLRWLSVQMRAGILWVGFVLMTVQSPDCHPMPGPMIVSAGVDEGLCARVRLCVSPPVSLYDLKVKTLTLIFLLLFPLVPPSFLVFNCFLSVSYFPQR